MISRPKILLFALSILPPSLAFGKAQCPSGILPVRYHSLDRFQMGVPVMINGSGPYEFMVDTGAQITIIDPSLAAELHLQSAGFTTVASGTIRAAAELVTLHVIELGPYTVRRPLVAIVSLGNLQALNPGMRGILGGNVLVNFNLLIDREHKLLCLDQTGQMQQAIRGEHIPLTRNSTGDNDSSFPLPPLVSVRLPEERSRDMVLMLDSGANLPLLYTHHQNSRSWLPMDRRQLARGTSDAAELFQSLPAQDVHIGARLLREITFISPVTTHKRASFLGEDGLLPTALFQRVFINYADRYVVFDPR